jgi:hypothetical protein
MGCLVALIVVTCDSLRGTRGTDVRAGGGKAIRDSLPHARVVQRELEDEFRRYGRVQYTWVARKCVLGLVHWL